MIPCSDDVRHMTHESLAPFHRNRRRLLHKRRQHESSSKANRQLVKRNPPPSSGGTELRISLPNTFTRNGNKAKKSQPILHILFDQLHRLVVQTECSKPETVQLSFLQLLRLILPSPQSKLRNIRLILSLPNHLKPVLLCLPHSEYQSMDLDFYDGELELEIDDLLRHFNRRLTSDQHKRLVEYLRSCMNASPSVQRYQDIQSSPGSSGAQRKISPLGLHLVVWWAAREWHSYTSEESCNLPELEDTQSPVLACRIAETMINHVFFQLEQRYGREIVSYTLLFITVSHNSYDAIGCIKRILNITAYPQGLQIYLERDDWQ
ncbi:unnamed protein product [Protopolystoma xenopodis]|uniref:Uncharacterized protein n=1 Tax=Protopolystoma xenopodis TaxID=117903 RepID=A0A3S4ZTR8_9PLAT|nr:unnamed protein product [Protopolystoma xenopodis]